MDIGFDTIGNATVICYDTKPILATDPLVDGSPYFGSWAHLYEIPAEQKEAILECPYIWFSHGHPDHLAAESLDLFKTRQILLPDHVGHRMRDELTEAGFKITVLPSRKWVTLSNRVKILCIADEAQNAVLLIDVGGRLLVNLNDCIDRGWGRFVRKIIRGYEDSVMLSLTGYGDADMINFWNEDGTFIEPPAGAKLPIGPNAAAKAESFGCKRFVPFSCMHKYQRADSVWATRYSTPIRDHYIGFESDTVEALPAFVRFFCDDGTYAPIMPKETDAKIIDPSEFGDNWDDMLEPEDVQAVTNYFRSFHHLTKFLDFVNIRVGGQDNIVEFSKAKFDRGLTFEVPRGSLMQAVEWQVFDDLLIGNFMKTTLHGKWSESKLYPDFNPYVTKYGDNGKAHTEDELREYFKAYMKRAPLEYVHHWLEEKATNAVRGFVLHDSELFDRLKKAYWSVKKHI